VWDVKALKGFRGMAESFPIRSAAHDDGDFGVRCMTISARHDGVLEAGDGLNATGLEELDVEKSQVRVQRPRTLILLVQLLPHAKT
jgi:hypothetical protein